MTDLPDRIWYDADFLEVTEIEPEGTNEEEYIRAAIVMKMIAEAVLAEREACAAVAAAVAALRDRTADAIRKRGERDD